MLGMGTRSIAVPYPVSSVQKLKKKGVANCKKKTEGCSANQAKMTGRGSGWDARVTCRDRVLRGALEPPSAETGNNPPSGQGKRFL